ncbi:hypothetical protein HWV62_4445, partial [Athelia sp. TMB]
LISFYSPTTAPNVFWKYFEHSGEKACPAAAAAWKGTTLAVLFGGIAASRRRSTRLPAAEVSAEAALMEALADIEEDSRLDEGAIEIDSDEEYAG